MARGVRRQGRELALKIIYGFAGLNQEIGRILADFWRNFRFRDDVLGEAVEDAEAVPDEVRQFADELARGVHAHLERIDARIADCSRNWSLDRMARVDLALLRLGTYELLFCPDVPTSVVINEAIEIGKRFGTAETPGFVNGILDRIARDREAKSAG
ncbi:NusB antitermination factor [Geothermobacter ehrlichii]|uniref:Transcription antitermination protein NusB n=1 Tax=Geothermobacter ehrlichii TaxID=213224 RepID=A0A5D3WPJ1_9BACT|nr:transcription antitermination factor NusB [Geothermobacter ehrlichii]TYP00264.1 NusB antitermination factor [Geothermobacter ehrlichii]